MLPMKFFAVLLKDQLSPKPQLSRQSGKFPATLGRLECSWRRQFAK